MKPDEIKALRKEKKLNQEEFGKLCGLSKAAVSRWEKGLNDPSGGALKILEKLRDGDLIVSNISELEVKLLDENVKQSPYESREDFLTESLKYLIMNGEFMPVKNNIINPVEDNFENYEAGGESKEA